MYHSGKKRFSLEEIANELNSGLLTLKGIHGIRWAASLEKSIIALLTDLQVISADLELTAKSAVGVELSLLSPSESFLRKSYFQTFEGANGGRNTRWKAVVLEVHTSDDGNSALDKFTVRYSDSTTLVLKKSELVQHLDNAKEQLLKGDARCPPLTPLPH